MMKPCEPEARSGSLPGAEMASSGEHRRPARVLLVVAGAVADRIVRVLRAHGHVVELARNGAAAAERLRREPPVDVIAIDGLGELDRARALAAARERDVWCIYLESPGTTLEAEERAQFVAAVPIDQEMRIARTVRFVVSARRGRAADG
jgi:CheY-like chemotaxis protein